MHLYYEVSADQADYAGHLAVIEPGEREECDVRIVNSGREAGVVFGPGDDDDDDDCGAPCDWFNSAKIIVNPEADSVSLTISTGDPRGAFCWTIRRRPDTGELLLHMPVREGADHHEDVECLHEGTWVISRSRPQNKKETRT